MVFGIRLQIELTDTNFSHADAQNYPIMMIALFFLRNADINARTYHCPRGRNKCQLKKVNGI